MASNPGNQTHQSNPGNQSNQDKSSQRGFAGMDPDRQREIAAEGGRAAHASGNAHEFTSEEAREAGSKSHGGHGGQGNSHGGNSNQGSQRSGGGHDRGGSSSPSSTRGGSSEQHAEAGRQSHKNDR